MTAAGIILASSERLAETIKTELGLTEWAAMANDTVRRIPAEPRLLIIGGDPYGANHDTLTTCFDTPPAVYWLTGSAL